MSVSVESESPDVIKVDLAGRVSANEWKAALEAVAKHLRSDHKISILVAAERFDGWGAGDWDDMSFQKEHDRQIRRLAIVVDRKWRDQALLFSGKGLRRIEIECFTPPELERARTWLTSS